MGGSRSPWRFQAVCRGRRRIYADFIFTLKPDDADAAYPFHQVFVVETKGLHLKEAADTEYKRSVFDICSAHATRREWAEFLPAMQGKAMRFEVVDEAEWQRRLTELLGSGSGSSSAKP